MDQGSTSFAFDEARFANDLAELRPRALREKYKGEASSHAAMKRRCSKGDFDLDPAWEDFRSFLRDMGPRPSQDATLDRVDHAVRRYGPGLVRWATKTQQTANRRNTIWLDFEGKRIRLQEFATRLNAKYSTIHSRITKGDTPAQIATSYLSPAAMTDGFQPAWITDADALRRWRAEYGRWLKRVRSDRRASAPPEVYAAIQASAALDDANLRLDAVEVAPSDLKDFEEKYAREIRVRNHGREWIRDALLALAKRDRSLAARLVPRQQGEWRDLWRFERWLTAPVDD